MDLNLRNKTVLVTGGSSGIGLATAQALAREGANLVLVSRSREKLAAVASELEENHNASITVHTCDVADQATHQGLAKTFADIDILINNAGAIPPGRLEDLTSNEIIKGWELKVHGYLGMMRAFYPLMKARGGGVILNVIGMSGERVNSGVIAISGGNAALIAATRALGAEGPEFGVRVLGVNPSATATERAVTLWKNQAQSILGDADRWPEMTPDLPFGRAAKTEEVANCITFLVSPIASYISGSVLNIDGGIGARP